MNYSVNSQLTGFFYLIKDGIITHYVRAIDGVIKECYDTDFGEIKYTGWKELDMMDPDEYKRIHNTTIIQTLKTLIL